ncbi:glycogen synthase [Cavenderia fasciculata]|uniref:Glycogen [starch] synthase n=1 Tax=Cavenderia fasciculata TaxID=261658 RepID=F4PT64_CACFS|nr:glycogen synthase [Cavenderia fasciculata]EGG20800.1 glycogen synthase [Cavenderia fasciculata]|eukprot:XP_004358650.1 glycogen synthase [Cavenderia fasciculata]
MSQLRVTGSSSASPLSFSSSIPAPTAIPQQASTEVALFDISWEVCKKVGGIYTVLKSKAPITVEEYKSRYALIGPYNSETAATEFEPLTPGPLTQPVIDNMMKKVLSKGILD